MRIALFADIHGKALTACLDHVGRRSQVSTAARTICILLPELATDECARSAGVGSGFGLHGIHYVRHGGK